MFGQNLNWNLRIWTETWEFDQSWAKTTTKKVVLCFLRSLKKFCMSRSTPANLHRCTVESTLTGCSIAWYGNSSTQEYKRLHSVVVSAGPWRDLHLHLHEMLPQDSSTYHQGSPSRPCPLLTATIEQVVQKPDVPPHQVQEQLLFYNNQVLKQTYHNIPQQRITTAHLLP